MKSLPNLFSYDPITGQFCARVAGAQGTVAEARLLAMVHWLGEQWLLFLHPSLNWCLGLVSQLCLSLPSLCYSTASDFLGKFQLLILKLGGA